MKKRILLVLLALVCMLALNACGCKHETWIEADCVTAKTCAECGETEGEPLGHSWVEATCEEAKTCSVCGETEGAALGHAWVEATCEEPKTCSACALTEGEALGHTWLDATTEAPMTCSACALTEGERIITDPRFTTASTADLQGTWVHSIEITGEMMELPDFDGTFSAHLTMVFGSDGTMTMNMDMDISEEFNTAFASYLAESLYAELAASGYDRAAADALMQEAYGMSVAEYAAFMMNSMDMAEMMSSIFGAMNINAVYYVDGNNLYIAMTWKSEFAPTVFSVDGDTLILQDDVAGTGAESTTFTRVTE